MFNILSVLGVIEVMATHLSYDDRQQCQNALDLLAIANDCARKFLSASNSGDSNERDSRTSLVQFLGGDMNTYFDYEWFFLLSLELGWTKVLLLGLSTS